MKMPPLAVYYIRLPEDETGEWVATHGLGRPGTTADTGIHMRATLLEGQPDDPPVAGLLEVRWTPYISGKGLTVEAKFDLDGQDGLLRGRLVQLEVGEDPA